MRKSSTPWVKHDSAARGAEIIRALAAARRAGEPVPTIRDLVNCTAYTNVGGVEYMLRQLETAGLIRRKPRLARSIALTPAGEALARKLEAEA